jgi:hypothetical protein
VPAVLLLLHANLLTVDEGAVLTNNSFPGDQVCDMSIRVFAGDSPGPTKNPIYTTLVGTNDADAKGVGSYESVYNTCLKASLAWLSIPSTYKTFAQNCSVTGTWSNDGSYISGVARSSTTAASTMTCPITTYGGPIYLFYKMFDTPIFNFSYTVDGGSPNTVSSQSSPPIATQSGNIIRQAYVRIGSLAAGSHTIVITLPSSNPGISTAGIATPAPNTYWGSPTVFAGGVLRQLNDVKSAATAEYDADTQADVAALVADGLRDFFVPVRNYVCDTLTCMYNGDGLGLHPNNTGHDQLRQAFAAAEQFITNPIIPATPADNAVCNPGQLWIDTSFIYGCTASGSVKRAALSTF